MTMRIVVQSIRPPAAGKTRSLITTTDGAKIGVYPELAALFAAGCTYDIETKTWSGNNGLPMTDVEKATKVNAASAGVASMLRPLMSAPSNPAPGQRFRTPEQSTVTEIICAYIAAGKCANPADLRIHMRSAVDAFRATWPDEEHYREAAE